MFKRSEDNGHPCLLILGEIVSGFHH
jgi:hypothetical protein